MKLLLSTLSLLVLVAFYPTEQPTQEFYGKAVYMTKTKMELGNWGARMSEAQKKQIAARLKNRLEKTYTLSFNRSESVFKEEEVLDAISGATDSWGKNFSPGEAYKNIADKKLVQTQEFYGKKFLVKDDILKIDWKMGSESKQIGQYTCFKATATIPNDELAWYNFSWSELRAAQNADPDAEKPVTEVEAWYTPQIPVGHGPAEYSGLPGLIMEVSAGGTTMLCSKIVINPKEKVKIQAPDKGKEIGKVAYKETVIKKMTEMMNNRGRRRSR